MSCGGERMRSKRPWALLELGAHNMRCRAEDCDGLLSVGCLRLPFEGAYNEQCREVPYQALGTQPMRKQNVKPGPFHILSHDISRRTKE